MMQELTIKQIPLLLNSIVLSASLFGSIYLFSTSLFGLNNKWINDKKSCWGMFEMVNGTIMVCSGIVMVLSIVYMSI